MSKIILFIVIIVISLWFVYVFDEVFNSPRAESFTGCAIDLCDQTIQDWHYKQNGNELYYARYEQGSKEYWTAYCNQMQTLPEELNHYKCL